MTNGTRPDQSSAPGETAKPAEQPRKRNPIMRFFRTLGPGLITGASDDDPSGIGTYAVTGASLGFSPLWTALLFFPLMTTVQYLCAKIGMVSGRGLAGAMKEHYPRWLLYPSLVVLIVANTVNAGADLGAIAAAIDLLVPVPRMLLVVATGVLILLLQAYGSYQSIVRVFKWLTLALFAYIGSAFFARPDLSEVLRATFIPQISLNKEFLTTLVALLGTTISPYLFFWQASQEVELDKEKGRVYLWQRRGATKGELRHAAVDVTTGMAFSQIVMYFIILSSAATLHTAGNTHVTSAAEAAVALRPLAGWMAEYLFAIGIIGAGVLAVPILTGSAGFALAEALGWKHGLNTKPRRAKEFYLTIAASTLLAIVMNLLHINAIDALFLTAVLNGILAPPLLVLVILLSNSPKVMGNKTNGKWLNILGWSTAILMFVAAVAMFLTM